MDILDSPIEDMMPPIERKLGKKTLTYDGYYMKFNGHCYKSDLESQFPLPVCMRTRASRGNPRRSRTRIQSQSFWKAQCFFRGLETTGKSDENINRLRADGNRPMMPELADLENGMHFDYVLQKAELEDMWMNKFSDNEKASEYPEKFLREKFFAGQDSGTGDTILVTVGSGSVLRGAAASLGLMGSSVQGSRLDEPPAEHLYHVAIGKNTSAVEERINGVLNNRNKGRQMTEEDIEKAHSDVLRSSNDEDWDVTGDWHISCPELEQEMGGPLTLKIHKGQPQMFAEFDFGLLHHIGATPGASGVFQFEQQAPRQKRKASGSSAPNAKRQRHDGIEFRLGKRNDQEDGDSNGDGKKIERPRGKSTTDMVSFWDNLGQNSSFTASTTPSIEQPTWNYQWRGTATTICLLISSKHTNSITFSDPKGTKLTGTFGGGIMYTSHYGVGPFCESQQYKFTGTKIGMGDAPRINTARKEEEAPHSLRAQLQKHTASKRLYRSYQYHQLLTESLEYPRVTFRTEELRRDEKYYELLGRMMAEKKELSS
ncbi:hypothetical protein EAF04_004331 [Stromatinia cepivora]|nr:hypothetical protein EAF04_004331 [Stromatinia cepivora]